MPHTKEQMAAYYRKRYTNDPEFRSREQARNKDNYARNGHTWKSQSPAVLAARSANRQAAKLGVAGRLTGDDIEAMWTRQPQCVNCDEGRGLDHISALVNDGANHPTNIQNLCLLCNQAKHKWDLRPGEIQRPAFVGNDEHCRRGHDRATSMRRLPSGERYCAPCHAEAVRRYKARRKAAAA